MNAHSTHQSDDDGVRVRRATIDDSPEIARLLTELGYPAGAEEMRSRWPAWEAQGNIAMVASTDAGVLHGVGTLHVTRVLHRPKPVGRITALVVDESQRGRGVGSRIVRAAEVELRGEGCGLLEITSNTKRVDAHAFYERLGYEKTSVRLFKSLESA